MCRALPWRQVHGDICYINVTMHDVGKLCITATTYGCFVNGVNKNFPVTIFTINLCYK